MYFLKNPAMVYFKNGNDGVSLSPQFYVPRLSPLYLLLLRTPSLCNPWLNMQKQGCFLQSPLFFSFVWAMHPLPPRFPVQLISNHSQQCRFPSLVSKAGECLTVLNLVFFVPWGCVATAEADTWVQECLLPCPLSLSITDHIFIHSFNTYLFSITMCQALPRKVRERQ